MPRVIPLVSRILETRRLREREQHHRQLRALCRAAVASRCALAVMSERERIMVAFIVDRLAWLPPGMSMIRASASLTRQDAADALHIHLQGWAQP